MACINAIMTHVKVNSPRQLVELVQGRAQGVGDVGAGDLSSEAEIRCVHREPEPLVQERDGVDGEPAIGTQIVPVRKIYIHTIKVFLDYTGTSPC
jgi:hypothetical protein